MRKGISPIKFEVTVSLLTWKSRYLFQYLIAKKISKKIKCKARNFNAILHNFWNRFIDIVQFNFDLVKLLNRSHNVKSLASGLSVPNPKAFHVSSRHDQTPSIINDILNRQIDRIHRLGLVGNSFFLINKIYNMIIDNSDHQNVRTTWICLFL